MHATPGWYALRSLEHAPSRAAIEADYPAPLFTRRVFSQMTAGILDARDAAPMRIAMSPATVSRRRRPPA